MKHSLFFMFIAIGFMACEAREEAAQFETDARPAYTFTETAGTASFSVTANIPWEAAVTAGATWCRVTPNAENGDGKVEISVAENAAYLQERTATIVVTAGTFEAEITVTQAPPSCPDFSAGSIGIGGETVFVGGTPATINSVEEATGGGVVAYQWYKNGVAIAGAISVTYAPPPADAAVTGVYTYTRRAKDDVCHTTLTPTEGSWALTVVACNFSAGTISSTGETIFVGGTPTAINSVQDATGGEGITYQWYKNNVAITGATAASYTPPPTDAEVIGSYTHTYTRSAKDEVCNTSFTSSAGSWALTVVCNFSAGTISSTGQTLVVGGTPAMINSIQEATGGGATSYQWYKNGNAISGATAVSYTPPAADATVAGTYTYTRRAKDDACHTAFTPSAGSWVLTVASCTFSAGAIATGTQTLLCSGNVVDAIISSADASGGDNTISYQWRRNGSIINGATAATYSPMAYSATMGAHTFTRWAHDGSCKTTWTQSAGQWALTVNGTPTITLLSGNTNQIKKPGENIEVIKYTMANASGASISGLPPGVAGSWNANTYTIDGTISADVVVQIYSYMVTTTNSYGCTNATASGQIIMSNIPTSTGGPNTAYSTTTWIIGAQTWTDRIIIPACNKTALTSSTITPDCRSYNDSGTLRYYYNWPYVNAYASALCPSPWRVPSLSDIDALVSNTNNSAMIGAWGYGGSGVWFNVSTEARFWLSTESFGTSAYFLHYDSSRLGLASIDKSEPCQLRCVK